MMDDVMKQGTIKCECGNTYFVQSIYPQVICMACKKMNDFNGEPIPEPKPEVTEDGTNI